VESISVPASLEVVPARCFAYLIHLSSLTFEPGSKLREIQDSAFANCTSLQSISLPASLAVISGASFAESHIKSVVIDESNPHYFVSGDFLLAFDGMKLIRYFGHSDSVTIGREIGAIGKSCFADSKSLVTVAFEENSRLTEFGETAFSDCSALSSICIPAQVEHICNSCFFKCCSLTEVRFERGSKLTRIDDLAFIRCHSLRLFLIPGQLEILESLVFLECESLSELRFEIPSKLRRLYLPMHDVFSVCIPDSVEVLSGALQKCESCTRLLQFGRESRLRTIWFDEIADVSPGLKPKAMVIFLRFSEGILRRFRCIVEAC
jgi:hypothetical protein